MAKVPAPYGLNVIQSCSGCVLHEGEVFCRLEPPALDELNRLRQTSFYPAGATLFVEGEPPRGVFILCSGQAKLMADSREGKSITLRIARAGQVLGLSSVVANHPYPVNAITVVPSQISFLPRNQFLAFLRNCTDVSLRIAEQLSMELHKAWEQTRQLALSSSAAAKLAHLLLALAGNGAETKTVAAKISLSMTHREMGEIIGVSRETVARLLGEFRNQGLIRTHGHSLAILRPGDLRALEEP
jgi:CRP/FNR family transcriptional regulator, cyclic AMP receptor protein